MLNELYQNIGIKDFMKRYGIKNAFKRGCFMTFPFHSIKNYEMKKVLWQDRVSKKIEKYLKLQNEDPEGLVFPKNISTETIWMYWNNGINNAPDIVKRCYESIVKYSEREVVVLTENNINDYIQLPKYVMEKLNSGTMPLAIYTDLVRFCLLEHYGGTWMDATILLTGKMPQIIFNSDFFVLRNSLGLLENPVLYPVWLMHAKKKNDTVRRIRNVLFVYWKNERFLKEYLLSNIIMTKVLKQFPEIEKNIPYMNTDYSEYLIKVISDEYSVEKADWIKSLTSIHKLSYKLDVANAKGNSNLRYILREKF